MLRMHNILKHSRHGFTSTIWDMSAHHNDHKARFSQCPFLLLCWNNYFHTSSIPWGFFCYTVHMRYYTIGPTDARPQTRVSFLTTFFFLNTSSIPDRSSERTALSIFMFISTSILLNCQVWRTSTLSKSLGQRFCEDRKGFSVNCVLVAPLTQNPRL